jgi:5-oxoprolinase (ATP-hydrolysing)
MLVDMVAYLTMFLRRLQLVLQSKAHNWILTQWLPGVEVSCFGRMVFSRLDQGYLMSSSGLGFLKTNNRSQSASAHPGPASYRKGGPLTVTDANLLLGRLIPDYFPKIFGSNEDQPLDVEIVRQKFTELTKEICTDSGKTLTPEEVASGFLEVANEAMCRPIRALTEARGYEISSHNLGVFGGAGGQHACEIAENLGIKRVVMHKYSSILSAYGKLPKNSVERKILMEAGMALAEVIQEAQEPSSETLDEESIPRIQARHHVLQEKVSKLLVDQDVPKHSISHEVYLNLRYQGSDTKLMVLEPRDGNWKAAFIAEHYREFAFVLPEERNILVDDIRIRGIGKSDENTKDNEALERELREGDFREINVKNTATETVCTMKLPQILMLTAISGMFTSKLVACNLLTYYFYKIFLRIPWLTDQQ